jgi:hypothetical protein
MSRWSPWVECACHVGDECYPSGGAYAVCSNAARRAPFDPAAVAWMKTLMGHSSSVAINDEVAELVLSGYDTG